MLPCRNLSLLHLALTLRALARSVSARFVFGIVGGLLRAALMLLGGVLGLKQAALVMLPGLTLHTSPDDAPSPALSIGLLLVTVVGPLLTLALLWTSYRLFQDVPAAREEELRRPFSAWLPVGILDAIYVIILIGAATISGT